MRNSQTLWKSAPRRQVSISSVERTSSLQQQLLPFHTNGLRAADPMSYPRIPELQMFQQLDKHLQIFLLSLLDLTEVYLCTCKQKYLNNVQKGSRGLLWSLSIQDFCLLFPGNVSTHKLGACICSANRALGTWFSLTAPFWIIVDEITGRPQFSMLQSEPGESKEPLALNL